MFTNRTHDTRPVCAPEGSEPLMLKPVTIENRWDILYHDYPEVYEAFAAVPKTPTAVEVVDARFGLARKRIVDVGAGTGRSTFPLAERAGWVVGVEPEAGMRAIAAQTMREEGISNVALVACVAEALPLRDDSVDMVVAMTLASLHEEENVTAFARESERVVRPGGLVVTVNIAPGWYGGNLAPVIAGKPRGALPQANTRDVLLERLGYSYMDYFSTQAYDNVDHIISTYGFIFGLNAISYIREREVTTIRWKARIHFKVVD